MPSPNLADRVLSTIRKYSQLSGKEKILVGLSGGPDSVCLLWVLNILKDLFSLTLHAIYIDHSLRPEETPHEKVLCEKLCTDLQIPFISKVIDVKTYAEKHGQNLQEAARELRYRVMEETAHEIAADALAVGHTADDQANDFSLIIISTASLIRRISKKTI